MSPLDRSGSWAPKGKQKQSRKHGQSRACSRGGPRHTRSCVFAPLAFRVQAESATGLLAANVSHVGASLPLKYRQRGMGRVRARQATGARAQSPAASPPATVFSSTEQRLCPAGTPTRGGVC